MQSAAQKAENSEDSQKGPAKEQTSWGQGKGRQGKQTEGEGREGEDLGGSKGRKKLKNKKLRKFEKQYGEFQNVTKFCETSRTYAKQYITTTNRNNKSQ